MEELPSTIRGLINDLTRTLTASIVHLDDLLLKLDNDSEEFCDAWQANGQLERALEFFFELRSDYLIWQDGAFVNNNKIESYKSSIKDKLLHTFNNLLAVVVGHCDLLQNDYADVGRICQGTDYICKTIKNVQQFLNETISLPERSTSIDKSDSSYGTVKTIKTELSMNAKHNKKIMLIEDDQGVSEVITTYLRKNKYSVVACSTGEKSLDILKRSKANFLIYVIDIGLPDIEGPDLIKEFLFQRETINVLFTSGYNEAKLKNHFDVIGKYPILTKPFRLPDLLDKIRSIELH
ncbi:MAG: response regulator [Desulfobaccales bacterium]